MSNQQFYSTFNAEEIAPEVSRPVAAQIGGVTSINLSQDNANVSTSGHAAVSVNDLSPYSPDDWRSTDRNSNGMPTSKITADSVVEIDGLTSKVGVLVRAGVLAETPEGYVLASELQKGSADSTSPENAVKVADSADMPEEVVSAVESAIKPFDQSTLDVGLAHSISVATGEMDMANVVQSVAQRSGLDPEEAAQRVGFVVQAYQAQADSYLVKQGVPQEELGQFYEFCKQGPNKGDLRGAIEKQMYGRDMSAWKGLVNRYMNTVPPDTDALEKHGLPVKGDQVKIQGVWMNVKTAARIGLI